MPRIGLSDGAMREEFDMIKSIAIAAVAVGILGAVPAFADEAVVGVGVGPVGAGVTVGESHERDRTTVIKEREPERERTTVIKKDRDYDHDHDKVIIDRR
jgi:hypothetical protein